MSHPRPWNVAVIGECMIELHKEGSRLVQTFGGDTLNTAAYLSRICGKDVPCGVCFRRGGFGYV